MEALITDKAFWQKVPLLDLEQVSVLITKFMNGQTIDIDQMLAPKISKIVYEILRDIGDSVEQDDEDVKVIADTNDSPDDV